MSHDLLTGIPMTATSECVERATLGARSLESYEPLIGTEAVRRILTKADALKGSRIAHISSTFYGGSVAEILTPSTLLMNAVGIETTWHLIQGTPPFFSIAPRCCTMRLNLEDSV